MNDTIVYNACPLHFTYLETFFIVFSIKLPFYALFSNASINIQKVCLKYHSKLNVQLNVCLVAGITMLIWGWRKMLSIKPVISHRQRLRILYTLYWLFGLCQSDNNEFFTCILSDITYMWVLETFLTLVV